jgi:hypothetical protein
MERNLLMEEDLRQLDAAGIPPAKARTQIAFFKKGVKPLKLNRPCTRGDGIVIIPEKDMTKMVELHDDAARGGRCMKFVPASGAASRMFAHWHDALAKGSFRGTEFGKTFADNLHRFAFFPDLKESMASQGQNVEHLLKGGELNHILHYILSSRGLNYGHLPKALLKFHSCPEGSRTALEEHLVEAAFFTTAANRECRIHFTVSDEHLKQTTSFLAKIREGYENRLGVTFRIELTTQSLSTSTVAMEGEKLYRDRSGRLILRPGGHGALLDNLNRIDGDIIFIKNIDNVAPDRLKPEILLYKKVLGGYFISLEKEIHRHVRRLSKGEIKEKDIHAASLFCRKKLHVFLPPSFDNLTPTQRRDLLVNRLNRPLRVCGMVKNEGEPGGGPFWIDKGGEQSLQIVEYQQIDVESDEQKAVWSASTHFNPVDLVCGVRDYQSQKFDLPLFADPKTVIISNKNEKGRPIRVLEHPGLWNGSMANWNTVFVEVPIGTFNPVKTIDDLLRQQHLPDNQ